MEQIFNVFAILYLGWHLFETIKNKKCDTIMGGIAIFLLLIEYIQKVTT